MGGIAMKMPTVTAERVGVGDAAEPSCAGCGGDLELHQPDADRPDRLLGTCPECGAWFLVDGETRAVHALPDVRSMRDR
jgi:hypothetical protein